MPAYRNVRLCGKDCICLYVCPTGATDTENSIIDVSKCLPGCRACADACPSGAISVAPDRFPPQQPKTAAVIAAQQDLGASKVQQEAIARAVAESTEDPVQRQFAQALAESNRRMAEDILRESGYLLPQAPQVRSLLEGMRAQTDADFPRDAVEFLLDKLQKA